MVQTEISQEPQQEQVDVSSYLNLFKSSVCIRADIIHLFRDLNKVTQIHAITTANQHAYINIKTNTRINKSIKIYI